MLSVLNDYLITVCAWCEMFCVELNVSSYSVHSVFIVLLYC